MKELVYIIGLMFWVMEDEVEQPEVNSMDLELEKMYQMWYEQQTKDPEPADDGLSFIPQNAVFLSIFLLLPLLSYKKWSNRSKIQTPDSGFNAEDCINKINKEQERFRSNQWKGLLKIRTKSPNMKPRRKKTAFAFCSMKCVAFAVDILRRWRKRTEHKSRAVYKKKKQPVTAKKRNNKPKIDFKKLVKKLLLCKKKKWLSKKKYASHESIKCAAALSPALCSCDPAMKAHSYEPVCKSSMLSKRKIKKLEKHILFKNLAIRFKLFPKIFLESRRMYRRSLLKSSASKKVFLPPARITSKPHYYWKWLHTKELLSTSTGRVYEEDRKDKFKECLGGMKEQLRCMKHAVKKVWRTQRLTLWFQSMKKTLNNCMKTKIRRKST